MSRLTCNGSPIFFGDEGWDFLQRTIEKRKAKNTFILFDSNTVDLLPQIGKKCPAIANAFSGVIPAGEQNKNLKETEEIWHALLTNGIDRNGLIICIGGGVVTDMGAFAASTYKRGIDFVLIPTSLMAQVDAAIGGKTGINIRNLKNQVGTFSWPLGVIVDTDLLQTLSKRHFNNGLAEVIKHGLIAEPKILELLNPQEMDLDQLVRLSVSVKVDLVNEDTHELDVRKKLNFGHTVGHAIETVSLSQKQTLLHGEAVAAGMILESLISHEKGMLDATDVSFIMSLIDSYFDRPRWIAEEAVVVKIVKAIQHDKKNLQGDIRSVLLSKVGQALVDQTITRADVFTAVQTYSKRWSLS